MTKIKISVINESEIDIVINGDSIITIAPCDNYVFFNYTDLFEQTDTFQWPCIKSEHLLKYIRKANMLILPFVSSISKLNDKYKIDED